MAMSCRRWVTRVWIAWAVLLACGFCGGALFGRAVESPVFNASAQVEAWARGRRVTRGIAEATGRHDWAVGRYPTQDWGVWDAQVVAWFNDLGRVALYAPPTAERVTYFSDRGLWEATGAFAAVTNAVPALMQGDVPTWPIWVWEQVAADGSRTFGTVVGTTVCREAAVAAGFNARRWVLQRYGEVGRQPPWTEAQGWFCLLYTSPSPRDA